MFGRLALLFLTAVCTTVNAERPRDGGTVAGNADAAAASYSVVHFFSSTGSAVDGMFPSQGVAVAPDGGIYGTTAGGLANGVGGIFRIAPDGTESNIVVFAYSTDIGYGPLGTILYAPDGRLYQALTGGGTAGGGANVRLNTDGSDFTDLHSFQFTEDGEDKPWSPNGLILGADGDFYASSAYGGCKVCGSIGYGTLYRMTATGHIGVMHTFHDGDDGGFPNSTLMQAADGSLYGTTRYGGAGALGTVFRITLDGGFHKLHDFSITEGNNGFATVQGPPLSQAPDGAIYGVTSEGGAHNAGTLYKVEPNGVVKTVHDFGAMASGARYPNSGLVAARDGNLYGTAGGGRYGRGTVYRLTPAGDIKVVYNFGKTPAGGMDPSGDRLAVGTDGALYGTTFYGGQRDPLINSFYWGDGVIFKITPGQLRARP